MAESGKKVLIADDEADVHAFVQVALEDDGHQILDAEDGEAALEQARAEAPDLVILDVQMPKKNGFEVFAELRGNEGTKAIPVIMLTSVSARTGIPFGKRDMGDYFGSEPDAYIDKPIDPETLRATVNKLLGIA
jgi:two-component system cell cycle response regulator DivK